MNYREAVKEGRVLVERLGMTQWELGDLALEVAPMGGNAARNGSGDKLQRFAADINIEFETLDQYRKVAAAFPPGTRVPGTSWTAHRHLMSKPHLLKPGMSVTQASNAAGHNNQARQPLGERGTASPQERARRAAQDLADPQVQRVAAKDPDAYRHVMDSAANVERERIRQHKPQDTRSKNSGIALFSLHAEMVAARQKVSNVIKMLPDFNLDDEARENLLADIAKTEDVLNGLRDMLQTGGEFDRGLAALLAEEE